MLSRVKSDLSSWMQHSESKETSPSGAKGVPKVAEKASLIRAFLEKAAQEPVRPPWYPRVPKTAPPGVLLDVEYDGQAVLPKAKLYDPTSLAVYEWFDSSGHHPYCYTDLSREELSQEQKIVGHSGFLKLEDTTRFDLLHDRDRKLVTIVTKDPLAIGGRRDSIREVLTREHAWEADIRYTHCYTMDRKLTPGLLYRIQENRLVPVPQEYSAKDAARIKALFKEGSQASQLVAEYLPLFLSPAPYLPRVALDIEVESAESDRIPDPDSATLPVIAAAFTDDTGAALVCLLRRKNIEGAVPPQLPKNVTVQYFEHERQLVETVFGMVWRTPLLLTYNGDNFDLRYLVQRAKKLEIPVADIPIHMTGSARGVPEAHLIYGVHVDLYRFFHNRSIQVYAFRNQYREVRLEDVSQAILGEGKLPLVEEIRHLSLAALAEYCWKDADLTIRLTQHDNDLVLNLILLLMRISHSGMDDFTRSAVSAWIRSTLYFAHRERKYLIPRQEEIAALKGEAATAAIIKGKKYMGAIVLEPKAGVHFDVTVLDFASLYPSLMKAYNLSYETVRCNHPECKSNKVPGTPHWICTKREGITNLIIGVIRDVRVEYFKPQSKEASLSPAQRSWFSVVEQALKVFLNASYGVLGASHFPLYCAPAAESVTALARHAITETIAEAEKLGVVVLYGDTDSLFLLHPTKEQLRQLIEHSERELKVELDVDKEYRYVALSSRKKNYLGVTVDGRVDIKGLTGKKRNTPAFLQGAFMQMVEILRQVRTADDFAAAKDRILRLAREKLTMLERREFNVADLAVRVMLTKPLETYTKTTPQHVKAARLLQESGREVVSGDIIAFVKTVNGVKPVEKTTPQEVDVAKYKDLVKSTFEQVLDALGVEWLDTIGMRRLDTFFG
jgi:DNA polymerase I